MVRQRDSQDAGLDSTLDDKRSGSRDAAVPYFTSECYQVPAHKISIRILLRFLFSVCLVLNIHHYFRHRGRGSRHTQCDQPFGTGEYLPNIPTYLPHIPTYLRTYLPTYLLTYLPTYLPTYLLKYLGS